MAQPETDEWITKKEAMKLLGVGDRQIDRRVKAGMITARRDNRKAHEKTAPVWLKRADVLALKEGEPNYHPVVETDGEQKGPGPEQSSKGKPAPLVHQAAAIQALFRMFAGPLALPAAAAASLGPAAPWVELDEAATLSGFPVYFIRRLLPEMVPARAAINLGSKSHPNWRVKRSEAADGFQAFLGNAVSSAASAAVVGSLEA